MRALNSLYRVLPEDTVHAIFSVYAGGGKFSRERSLPREGPALARLKADAICALMRAMLNADRFPHPDVSNAEIVSRLVAAASANAQGKGFDDSKTDLKRARATAVEAIALVRASLGKDEPWRLVDNAKNGQGRKERGANLRGQLTTRFEDARDMSASFALYRLSVDRTSSGVISVGARRVDIIYGHGSPPDGVTASPPSTPFCTDDSCANDFSRYESTSAARSACLYSR